VFNSIGRTAADKDARVADALAMNRQLRLKEEALEAAKAGAAQECRRIGPRCKAWQARIDELTAEMAPLRAVEADPQAAAVARLVALVGADAAREVVAAIQPAAIPTFLELGAIILLGVAFPHRRKPHNVGPVTAVAPVAPGVVHQLEVLPTGRFNETEALRDFQRMRNAPSQAQLAQAWGVDKSTVSRWLGIWEISGVIKRRRDGRHKQVLALPAPRH
jgi:hypothetical protein